MDHLRRLGRRVGGGSPSSTARSSCGINLFDTADVYVRGGAERALGAALRSLPREQVVVATKVMGRVWDGPLGAGLSRKHIFDAHGPEPEAARPRLRRPLSAPRARQDARRSRRRCARSRTWCARARRATSASRTSTSIRRCSRRAVAIQKARGWERFVSSQPRYNLLEPRIESEHMPFCKRNGIGLIVYSPLAPGRAHQQVRGRSRSRGQPRRPGRSSTSSRRRRR